MSDEKLAQSETASSIKDEAEEPIKKEAITKQKEEDSTRTYNDSDVADLAKLTALNARGDHMQFSMGKKTVIGYGDTPAIERGKLTVDNKLLADPDFEIYRHNGKWYLKDISDQNHIYVNDLKIAQDAPTQLLDGALIRVTDEKNSMIFVFEDNYNPQVEWKSHILKNKKGVITIYSSEALEQMSRADSAAKDKSEYPHAEFVHTGSQWQVKDVNIDRGITVNGKKINNATVIDHYDVIRIGSTIFVYLPGRLVYNLPAGKRKNLIISIAERTVKASFTKKKTLLKDISLTLEPGQLVLLLGGSGAGKTTFINAVTGYEPANAKILNGGIDVYENYNDMKYEIAVVPQQDLLRGTDTVYMTLFNSAELRLPTSYSMVEKKQRVDEVLEDFGLTHQKNSLVKELSGGQRKRLSIACEYIGDPSLFILDEPDSGLDGVIARELMERLRRIADTGKIVLVITHTPDRVVDLFDHIIVLAKDSSRVGRLAFFGTIDEARKFFEREKMEDIVKCINTKEEGGDGRADELIARFEESRKEAEKHA